MAELGALSANRAAIVLDERGLPTAAGSKWTAVQVVWVRARLDRLAVGNRKRGSAMITIIVEGNVVVDVVSDDPALIGKTVRLIDYNINGADQATLYLIPRAGGHDIATVREETIVRTAVGEPVPTPPPPAPIIPKRLSDAWKSFVADAIAKPPYARSAAEQEEIRWAMKHD